MALFKVIELIAESKKSWEEATQNAVDEVSKTIRKIHTVHAKNFSAEVNDGKITRWKVNCEITFEKE